VKALDTMAAAMCLRTPRTGIRSSPPAAVPAVTVRDPFPEYSERAGVSATAARCTSSRVIEPSGPLPASSASLMPRSLASLRTGGLARARAAGTPGPAARDRAARGSAGGSGGSTGRSDAVGTSAVSGRPAAAATAGGVRRARRVVADVLTP